MAKSLFPICKTSLTKGKRSKNSRVIEISHLRGSVNFTTTSTAKKVQECPVSPLKITFYSCSVCGKVFLSREALGGHKSSHRAQPILADWDPTTFLNYVSALNPSGKPHKCSVCGEIFRTGQALGGHMRKHYRGVTGCTPSHSDVHVARVVRDFDLNLPPAPEIDLTLRL